MTITRTELQQPVAAFEPLSRAGPTRRGDPAPDGQTAAVKESSKNRDDALRAAQESQSGASPSTKSADSPTKTVKLPDFPLHELAFRLDPATHRVVVQVIDSKTKDVVRQYPPDESIQVLKQLRESRGLLLDETG
jgi:flagellar protein FlaG